MPTELPPPTTTLSGFNGAHDTLRTMVALAHGERGEQNMWLKGVAEEIVRHVQPKDYLGEILAIRYWVAEHVRYVNDPLHVEAIKDPTRLTEEILAHGVALADCDEIALLIGTLNLLVGRVAEFIVAGFGEPGQYSHVFARVMEPRTNTWIICDPVAGTEERAMALRVTSWEAWSLDDPALVAA
jgi:hypothetical protein